MNEQFEIVVILEGIVETTGQSNFYVISLDGKSILSSVCFFYHAYYTYYAFLFQPFVMSQ